MVSRATAKTYFDDGDVPTQTEFGDVLDSVVWGDEIDTTINAYGGLGSAIIAQTAFANLVTIESSVNFSDGGQYYIACYIPKGVTITGVMFFQATQGVYNANNTNSVGLYTYSAGTVTNVAESVNDGDLFKGAANSFVSKDFATPYAATKGIHFISFIYNVSSQSTAPTIGRCAGMGNAAQTVHDFTNSAKIFSLKAGRATMEASTTMSTLTNFAASIWLGLY